MASGLCVVRAELIRDERTFHLETLLSNHSTATIGPGGLRMRAERSLGHPILLSISNHWPLVPQGEVCLTSIVPTDGLKQIDFVDYIETDGTVHPLGDKLSIGWFFCDLKRGTAGADVQA